MQKGSRILVAMSGGVDSSVAACLLREQGHDVVGVFMRLGAERYQPATDATSAAPELCASAAPELCASSAAASHANNSLRDQASSPKPQVPSHAPSPTPQAPAAPRTLSLPLGQPAGRARGCCSAADATDARLVAGRLGIPFYALNFEADFNELVDYFVAEYANARTPNPCIRCNQWLKFGRLMEYAAAVEADYIATGHYARLEQAGGRTRLLRARDERKDQSYVLFGVDAATLARTRFPLGGLTKAEVRSHARRLGLALHDKPESQDICFVPDRDYARLVRQRSERAFRPGRIVHVDGRELGMHEGIGNFTVGQRRGLRIAAGEPIYVASIDPATDTVYVGPREAVLGGTLRAGEINWLAPRPDGPIRAAVKIRYQHAPASATVTPIGEDAALVEFDEPQTAITPGQAAVFYDGDEVLGGGWIEEAAATKKPEPVVASHF